MAVDENLDFEMFRKEIIDRFEKNIQAHWDKDVDFITDDLGEGFFSMSEAEVNHPTKEDQRNSFMKYLNNTTFKEYTSLEEPEIGFSDDGSIAWGNFKVRVRGKTEDKEFSFDCAWLWLFRRVDDRWMRIGEVSTWK